MTTTHNETERAELIRHMVNRFLAWKLPKEFYPDSFISFDREKHETWGGYPNSWPTGTNLFTAEQAKEMLEYLLEGYEPANPLQNGEQVELIERLTRAAQEESGIYNSSGWDGFRKKAAALLSSDAKPAQDGELPPLPKPFMELHEFVTPVMYNAWAKQMRDYARAALLAADKPAESGGEAVAHVKDDPLRLEWVAEPVLGPVYIRPQQQSARVALTEEKSELYWRLHSLSKALEGSGRIDEHEMPDAYATILDAMAAAAPKQGGS